MIFKLENIIRPPQVTGFVRRSQPRNMPIAHRQSMIAQHLPARNNGHNPSREQEQIDFFRPCRIQTGNL